METNFCSTNITDVLLLFITILGIVLALFQFISYRNELRNRTFLDFRQRFKSDKIILKILETLNSKDPSKIKDFPAYEHYHFLGFYEELEKMYSEKQVSIEDIHYFFGYYLLVFMEIIRIPSDSKLWKRALRLYDLIKRYDSKTN